MARAVWSGSLRPRRHHSRGFELEDGRFVELTDDDVDRLDVELTHTIDICTFVSIDEIDPLFFRKAWYLLLQDGAGKPYRLLLRTLEEMDRVAIAKVVLRDKQYLACVRPTGDRLLLETMYYRRRQTARLSSERVGNSGAMQTLTLIATEVPEPQPGPGEPYPVPDPGEPYPAPDPRRTARLWSRPRLPTAPDLTPPRAA